MFFTTIIIKIMYLVNDGNKILAFSQFNGFSHLLAFDHERHLVSWLLIKLCDVGAGQMLCTKVLIIIINNLIFLLLLNCQI